MKEIARTNAGSTCHPEWHEYIRDWISFENWLVEEGLMLLAGIWPVDVKISDSEIQSPRYGVLEPPVILKAGLLDEEVNFIMISVSEIQSPRYGVTEQPAILEAGLLDEEVNFITRDDGERHLIRAGKRLSLIRQHWIRGHHANAKYPPAYFIEWAASKSIVPCWFDIWQAHVDHEKGKLKGTRAQHLGTDISAPSETPQIGLANLTSEEGESVHFWIVKAREIADEFFDRDTEQRVRDSCKGYAKRVHDELQRRGIHGPRGPVASRATVLREALQGPKWWANKKK